MEKFQIFQVIIDFLEQNRLLVNEIINIIFVGFFEILLAYIFAILICRGTNDEVKKDWKHSTTLILLTVSTLALVRLNRNLINNFIITTMVTTFIYFLGLRFVLKLRTRFSILGASLIMLLFMLTETLTVQPVAALIQNVIRNNGFMGARFYWSLPTRVVQLFVIFALSKFRISFKNNILFKKDWKELTDAKKITTIILLSFLLLSIYFNANYAEIFMKIKMNNIPIELFKSNLTSILISTVIFLIIPIIILLRTTNYESLKDFAYKKPEDAFAIWLKASTPEQRENYQKQLNHFNKVRG